MKSKLATILLSCAIAVGLWLYVITNVSPGSEQNFHGIPVTIENESVLLEKGLILVGGQDSRVSVRLKGNRSDLNDLNSNNIKATVDLGTISEPGSHQCEYRVSFPSGISSVSLEKRLTEVVTIEVAEYEEKQVPVQLILQGEQQEGLFIDKEGATTSVAQVMVSGPKQDVDQIAKAGIVLDVSDLTETLYGEFVYTLMNENNEAVVSDNIETDTGAIHVILPVEYIKQIPLTVKLIEGGGAKEANAVCDMETETLTISGSKEALSKIDELQIATVNLGEVDLTRGYTMDAPIKLPESLTNHSGIGTVHIKVTLKDLASKTLTLTNERIVMKNLPEGMIGTISNLKLDIVVRGPASQLSTLTAEQLTASVDFKDQAPGTYTLPVTIEITGAKDAGAYGKYSVTVTMEQAPTDETIEEQ